MGEGTGIYESTVSAASGKASCLALKTLVGMSSVRSTNMKLLSVQDSPTRTLQIITKVLQLAGCDPFYAGGLGKCGISS